MIISLWGVGAFCQGIFVQVAFVLFLYVV